MDTPQNGLDRISTDPGIAVIGLPILGQISTNYALGHFSSRRGRRFIVNIVSPVRKVEKSWRTLTSGISSRIEPCYRARRSSWASAEAAIWTCPPGHFIV